MTTVTIGNGLITIERNAFFNCSSLTTVIIGENTETIDSYAFAGCTSLSDVTMNNGVQTIGENAFKDCSSLITIEVGSSVKTIEQYAFYNCSALESIEIPGNVETIGLYAFKGCSKLETVTLNEGLKTIQGGAFMGCPIKELVIPDSVTSIQTYIYRQGQSGEVIDGAFENCAKLTTVTIGNGLSATGRNMFWNCTALSSITFTGAMEQWNALTFGADWHKGVPAAKVICSDGEVALS